METQTITWTVLPNGVDGDDLVFSVHVAPRLHTDDPDATLGSFEDWIDWPQTLAGITFSLRFPELDLELPANPIAPADSARWTSLFPSGTTVRSHVFKAFDHIKILSYPVQHVIDFLIATWGKFGLSSPDEPPEWAALAAPDAFGPIGFEQLGGEPPTGPERKHDLLRDLNERFNVDPADPASSPATWAIPWEPAANQTGDELAINFLQLEQFLRRDLSSLQPPLPPLEQPSLDFHDGVALTRDHALLQRLIGLVLDFRVPLTRVLAQPQERWVTIVPTWTPQLPGPTNHLPRTRCAVAADRFEAVLRPPPPGQNPEQAHRHLRLGDPSLYRVVNVDPDGGGIKALQFADNVTRSRRNGNKLSLRTPERYALPALRSAGISVARLGRASRLAHVAQIVSDLNLVCFEQGQPSEPYVVGDVYADDLTRGYRWDVYDDVAGRWETLMRRTGTYHFLAQGDPAGVVAVSEESTVVTAPTTNSPSTPERRLYLQESMARWAGWSLAAPRPGQTIGLDGSMHRPANAAGDAFAFEAHFAVPPAGPDGGLPRLRFGHRYRMRARAVDLAGNSVPFSAQDPTPLAELATPLAPYLRYEPVEAPHVVLRQPHTPGESNDWVVIRSENKDDQSPTQSSRHLVPPRMSQLGAEQHGLLDGSTSGRPLDKAAYDDLVALDKGRIEENGELEPGSTDSYYFDALQLPVNYLAEILARRAVVRGLPDNPGPGVTDTAIVAFEPPPPATWPDYRSWRLELMGGPNPGWLVFENALNRVLGVTLDKGDQRTLRVSCQFDPIDLELMGVWHWIEEWAADHNLDAAAARAAAERGSHWMLTPYRPVTLVHAVRTPLAEPTFLIFTASKQAVGATGTVLSRLLSFSRKSTSKIDLLATWTMKIDNGPGDPGDPEADVPFAAPAATLPIPTREGNDELQFETTHEFGDTKHRLVTYEPVATTAFTEYFRTETTISLTGSLPLSLGFPFEPSTVKVHDLPGTGRAFRRVPGAHLTGGELFAAINAEPATGDYILDEVDGTIRRTAHGGMPEEEDVQFSYVAPQIHATGPTETLSIPNSARPAAPKVLYVVPAFAWSRDRPGLTSTRKGGGLRVYLERPWWSSGDGEQLGVVLWRGSSNPLVLDPPEALLPYVTMWGLDPVYQSANLPNRPTAAHFPLAGPTGPAKSIAEVRNVLVDVAPHDVHFDAGRDLWYCDIQIDAGASYFPFVRLALARYQADSIADTHLSPVVAADFIQLAPDRTASVTPVAADPRTFFVTLTGPTFTSAFTASRQATVAVERRRTDVPDDELGWLPISTTALTNPFGFWQGQVNLPSGPRGARFRFVFEERELLPRGDERSPQGYRVVHTDVIDAPL